MRVKPVANKSGEQYGWIFYCPGCQHVHVVGKSWSFNGDQENPTFSPSILVTYTPTDPSDPDVLPERCHSFVTDGKIRFLGDCTHHLAGQTVDLPSEFNSGLEA